MRLIPVNPNDPFHVQVLWWLLGERTSAQSISHKTMPTFNQHREFVQSHPYMAWYLIEGSDIESAFAGAVYLSMQREIGISVLRAYRGRGLAMAAINDLMRKHPGKFLANINPANEASIALFRKLGFAGPVQVTLERTDA